MTAERVVGSILLGVALLCGLALVFLPLGAAWNEPPGELRLTETYRLFTKNIEHTASGEAADGSAGQRWYYIDDGLDGTGGITFLRAAGPLMAGGLLVILASLLLTSLPGVNRTRAGGAVALPGALLYLGAVAAVVLGAPLQAEGQVASAAQVDFDLLSLSVAAFGALALGFAVPLGLMRSRSTDATEAVTWEIEDDWDEPEAQRELQCPQCSTLVAAPVGRVPICPSCGFGSDYSGPAGEPVPGRALTT